MAIDLSRVAIRARKPLGISSFAILALYLVWRGVLGLGVFSSLNDEQTFVIVNAIIDKSIWAVVGLAVLGILAYTLEYVIPRKISVHEVAVIGNVLDETGKPVAGAIVFVDGIDRRRITDDNGWFHLVVHELSTYTVRAIHPDGIALIVLPTEGIKDPIRLTISRVSAKLPAEQSIETKRLNTNEPGKDGVLLSRGRLLFCSFCGKSQHEVLKLIAGPSVYICDECTDLCIEITDEEMDSTDQRMKALAELCELSIRVANPALTSAERTTCQEDIQSRANLIRSRKRERSGDIVAGARLLRVVGSGNFATVWEALEIDSSNAESDRKVAVKIFDQNKLTVGLMLWRFQRGIRAMQHLAKLGNFAPKSIVRVKDVPPNLLAFSMQFLPGGDLERIRRHGWSVEKKLKIFSQVCSAVQFAHSQGIVHRDIKPANVVLDENNDAVLTDFDIADLQFAQTQSVYAGSLGTPQFAAPEQLTAESIIAKPTADIYSLGKLLYFLILETPPPLGSTELSMVPKHLANIEDSVIRETIHRAINHDPMERFQRVEDMISVLRTVSEFPRQAE